MDDSIRTVVVIRDIVAALAIACGIVIGGIDVVAFVINRPELSVSAAIRHWHADRPEIVLMALFLVWHLFIQR